MEWDYEATYLSNKSRKGLPTGNADVGPMGRFLKQMGDNRWELVSVMKIGESFGGEDEFLYHWKRPKRKQAESEKEWDPWSVIRLKKQPHTPKNLSFCLGVQK